MQKTRTSRSSVDHVEKVSIHFILRKSLTLPDQIASYEAWNSEFQLNALEQIIQLFDYIIIYWRYAFSMQKTRTSRISVDHAEIVRRPGLP